MDERAAEIVRSSSDTTAVDEWSLVLAAAGIPFEVDAEGGALRILVPAADAGAAAEELAAYERESECVEVPEEVAPEWGESAVGVVVALLLVGWFRATEPGSFAAHWVESGAASEAIARGEVWRAVTALTLHHDAAHLLGNVVGSCLFVTALGRVLGPGVAAALALAAGAGGNVLGALLRSGPHSAVGASTAVFGAIGALGAVQGVRRRGAGGFWVPVAGSLGLLAMLGTGERADLMGHLCGLAAGVALGVVAALRLPRPPRGAVQAVLALGALAVVAGCWLLAVG